MFNKIGDGTWDWLECPDGQYYSYTFQTWKSCTGSCYSEWAYQSFWFDWADGQYYDLDTQTWVSQWNSTTRIAVNSTMFGNKLVWRSFIYYIDSLSTKNIELGTKLYPYKDIRSALIETVNLFSNTNMTATIRLKENTQHYLSKLENNVFINIGNVIIESYSTESTKPSHAILVGNSNTTLNLVFSASTLYTILKNRTMELDSRMAFYTNQTGYSSSVTVNKDSVITVLSTNITFNRISFQSKYSDITLRNKFVNIYYPRGRKLYMANIIGKVSGILVQNTGHMDIRVYNLTLDWYMIYSAFIMDMRCSNTSQLYIGSTVFDNLTFYYSADRVTSVTPWNLLDHQGAGNWNITNVVSEIGHNYPSTVVGISLDDQWVMPDGVKPVVEVKNAYFTSPSFITSKQFFE